MAAVPASLPRGRAVSGSGWRFLALVVAVLVAWPLAGLFLAWFDPQPQTWSHLWSVVLPRVLKNSLVLAVGVGAGVLVTGTGLAWLMTAFDFPLRRFLERALVMPLAIPAYVLAFVYLGLLDYSGPVQSGLRSLFGNGHWFPDVHGAGVVISVFTLAFYPYVYLLVRSALLNQSGTPEEVARTLGCTRAAAFRRVVLPMIRPAIVVGVALALMETLADFGAVAVFNYDTFTIAIYRTWFSLFNLPAAAQLSTLLLLLVGLALLMERRFRGQARFFSQTRATRQHPPRLPRGRGVLAAALGLFVFALAFAVPVMQLALWATSGGGEIAMGRFLDLVTRTLSLAVMAGALTTAIGLLLAIARRQAGDRPTALLTGFAGLGYSVPGTVLAVAVMLWLTMIDRQFASWFGETPPLLTGGVLGLLVAYTVRFLALALGPVESGLERLRPVLVESARSLGATSGVLVVRVIAPLLRPGLLAAVLLVVVEVMKELPATLMLRPFGWDTLAVRIYELTSEGEWERAALPALVLVLVGLFPVVLLMRSAGRG